MDALALPTWIFFGGLTTGPAETLMLNDCVRSKPMGPAIWRLKPESNNADAPAIPANAGTSSSSSQILCIRSFPLSVAIATARQVAASFQLERRRGRRMVLSEKGAARRQFTFADLRGQSALANLVHNWLGHDAAAAEPGPS